MHLGGGSPRVRRRFSPAIAGGRSGFIPGGRKNQYQPAARLIFRFAQLASGRAACSPSIACSWDGNLYRDEETYFRRSRLVWGIGVTMNVEHEINLLVEEIRRLGTKNSDGTLSVKFGVLFADEKCANLFEALVGTLKAAKRRKIVSYPGELLLQGVHDNVDILLLQD
uniref:Costars family protein ABRACL n=1 Tax=Naja naja TaxID=35670 RepID=A0A8C6X1R5_NAJNA